MNTQEIIKRSKKFAQPFRVSDGSSFRLKEVDPGDTLELSSEDKPRAKEVLALGVQALTGLQDMLYAQDRWALLLIFQAMDAAGKDVPSSMSCPGLTRRVVRSIPSRRPRARILITIICGAV